MNKKQVKGNSAKVHILILGLKGKHLK